MAVLPQITTAQILEAAGAKAKVDDDGQLHCADGPAVVWPRGTKSWYWHGDAHGLSTFNDAWSDDKKAWWMRAKMDEVT